MQRSAYSAAQPDGGQHFVVQQGGHTQPVDGCNILGALDAPTDNELHINRSSSARNAAAFLKIMGVVGESHQHGPGHGGHRPQGVADRRTEGRPLAVCEVGGELADQAVPGELRQRLQIVGGYHHLRSTGIQPSSSVSDFKVAQLNLAPILVDHALEGGLASIQHPAVHQKNLPHPRILLHKVFRISARSQCPVLKLHLRDHREHGGVLHHLRPGRGP
mmetsp:Transcript_44611/g.97055  ORF Transcript_44611/g.97055 Transcript_44611/m.97055 type:complete len:218 (-) Transcript_44611:249-902(-)